jgi:DNA-binding winged helix-turn-helix (wHTH) protein
VPEKMVRFDDFQLDYGRFQLCRRGTPIRLEGLPLQLLMFLVEKRGQLVTREGINTAIRKIRRALADDAGEPQYLQTVVGRGYRFVAPSAEEDAVGQPQAEAFVISPEELGRAIMTAAGLDPENPRGTSKVSTGDRPKSER